MGQMTGEGSAKKRIMHLLDETGDTTIEWTTDSPVDMERAQAAFDQMNAEGFTAFDTTTEPGKRIDTFDPAAHERVVFVPRMAGG